MRSGIRGRRSAARRSSSSRWPLRAAVAPVAGANVYKCADDGGGVIYQEEPCPPGKELRNFDTDPPDLSVIHGAPARRSRHRRASRKSAERKPANASASDRSRQGNGAAPERKFIRTGMTEAEVVARIGRPDMPPAAAQQPAARWSYLPADGDPDTDHHASRSPAAP